MTPLAQHGVLPTSFKGIDPCHTHFTAEETEAEVGRASCCRAGKPSQSSGPGLLALRVLPRAGCLPASCWAMTQPHPQPWLLSELLASSWALFANSLKSFQACSPGFSPRLHALSARALTSSLLQMGHLELNAGPGQDFHQH